jgi:cobalt-zinc-cadmium efflux system membrane fusion protein
VSDRTEPRHRHRWWLGPLLVALGCGGGAQPKATPPAKVSGTTKEADLGSITLTAKAAERLGLRTTPVARRQVARARTVGGEIVVPSGQSVAVTAPVAGTVVPPGGAIPPAGAVIKRRQVIVRLVPLPSPADLQSVQVRLEAARKRVQRAEQLLKDGAGSQRAYDDAAAELALAESQTAAVRTRGGGAGALAIESPQAGVLRNVLVGAGQSVASGAPLFQVDAVTTQWVRVPVYVGDLGSVERDKPILVQGLAGGAQPAGRPAQPVAAPSSANPEVATTDLYYQIDNADGAFRPGQKVGVSLPLQGGEESLVVPWSAVVHDIHGGTWVYEDRGAHVYARRRVEVHHVVGGDAVLARGPPPGAPVVTTGVAELYGTEFGSGK